MPFLQCDNTLQRSCAIFSIGKFAIRGLFFCLSQSKSVSRVKQHSGSDFCSLLPFTKNLASEVGRTLSEHENRHNRHRLFRNFPRLLRAIECKMAILLLYLSLLYVEKKQRYKLLKQAEHSKCNSKIGNASFA